MIKTIKVTNHRGQTLTIDLRNPWEAGFAIRGYEGFGPVKANIIMSEASGADGSRFNSVRAERRNILLYIRYLYAPTIEDSRKKTYKYFPIKEKVKITVVTDSKTMFAEGYVESNEAIIASKTSGANISIVCPEPYLKSEKEFVTTISGVTKQFEFPFSNESTTEPLIEFGSLQAGSGVNVYYDGDKISGLNISIKAIGTVENLMFYNTETSEFMKIDTTKLTELTGDPIIAGDIIEINTNPGTKEMLLYRDGEYINIINTLDRDSTWLTMRKGDNVFAYSADVGGGLLAITVRYRELYEGV